MDGTNLSQLGGKLCFDSSDNYFEVFANAFFGKEIALGVIYENNVCYVSIGDIFVKMSKVQFESLAEKFGLKDKISQGGTELKNKLKELINSIDKDQIISKLKSIKNISVDSNGIGLSLDLSIFGLEGEGRVYLEIENNIVKAINFENFAIADHKVINGKVQTISNSAKKTEIDKEKYLDAYEVLQKLEALKDLNQAKFGLNVNVENQDNIYFVSASAQFDRLDKYLNLSGKFISALETHSLNISVLDDIVYAQVDSIKVKASLEKIKNLLSKIDGEKIKNKLEELLSGVEISSIDLDIKLLNLIKKIEVNNHRIALTISKEMFGLEEDLSIVLGFEANELISVELRSLCYKQIKVDFKAERFLGSVVKKAIQQEEYLDVLDFANNIVALKDASKLGLDLSLDAKYKNDLYNLNANVELDLTQNYLGIFGNFAQNNDQYNLSLLKDNEQIYAMLNNIKVQAKFASLLKLLSKVGIEIGDVEISKLSDFMDILPQNIKDKFAGFKVEDILSSATSQTFDIQMLSKIKNLVVNSDQISLTLERGLFGLETDLEIAIDIANNKITKIDVRNLSMKDIQNAHIVLEISEEVEKKNINKEEYLDVETLINNVIALDNSQNLAFNVNAIIKKLEADELVNDYELEATLNKLVQDEKFMAYLNGVITYQGKALTIDMIEADNTLYASLNNMKVQIANNKVLESVHKVLSLIGKDTNAYDNLINKIVNVLGSGMIKSAFQGEEFKLPQNQANISGSQILSLVKDIITNATINSQEISILLDAGLFGLDGNLDLNLKLENQNISKLSIKNLQVLERFVDVELCISQNNAQIKELKGEEKEEYIEIDKVVQVAENTYNSLKNMSVSGTLSLDFEYGGQINTVVASYGLKISKDKKLYGYINAKFYGLSFNIFIKDSQIFMDVGGTTLTSENRLQISIKFSEFDQLFDWIEQTFNIKIGFRFNQTLDQIEDAKTFKFDFENIRDAIFGKDLGFISKVVFEENSLEAILKSGQSIFVSFAKDPGTKEKIVSKVVFKTNKITANILCESFDDVVLKNLDTTTYKHYTFLTETIERVIATFKADPFEMYANINLFKNKILNMNVEVGYQDEYLFANIKGMKLSLQRQSIAEILAIVLETMGIDSSIISFIGDVSSSKDFDMDNIQNIIPAFDMGNPFKILSYLKAITLNNGVFEITLDSSMFGKEGNDIVVRLSTNDQKISRLEILNFEISDNQYVNIEIEFERRISESTYQDYIDLSNSADLVKALVNTSSLNDFHINGNIILNLNIASTDFPAATLGVDARVKLDENKNPFVAIDISNIPLIGLVTDKNTNGVGGTGMGLISQRHRTMSIIYSDGELILRTVDEKWGAYKKLTRVTKITPAYLMENLKYYMQWLMGLSDSVQNKINEAIDKSASYEGETDFSKIILSYQKVGNTHEFVINLAELAHNDQIGTLSIGLTTSQVNVGEKTRDYIYSLDINLDVLDGLIKLKTDGQNKLYLKDIGQSVDSLIEADKEYINNYPYNEYAEYEQKADGAFSQTNKKTITISLDNNGGDGVTSVSGNLGDNLALPIPTKILDNGIYRVNYKFVGWYTNEGKLFEGKSYPNENISLVAHWEEEKVEFYRTLSIDNQGKISNTSYLEGTKVTLNALQDYFEDDSVQRIDYTFVGYSIDGKILGKEITIEIEADTRVIAVWDEYVRNYYTISFDTDGKGTVQSVTRLQGENLTLEDLADYKWSTENQKITSEFLGWFETKESETRIRQIEVSQNKTYVAKWWDKEIINKRTLTLKHANEVLETYRIFEKDQIEISNSNVNSNTKFYTDAEFKNEYILGIMPERDLTLYIRNQYTISFNSNGGTNVNSITAYEGESISLPSITKGKTGNYLGTKMDGWKLRYQWDITSYAFAGWKLESGVAFDGKMPSQNITLVASWNETTTRVLANASENAKYLGGNFD